MVKPRWTADVRNIETCKWNKWSIVVNVILVNIRLKLTVIRGQKTNKIKRLHLLLTVKESAMDVPSNLESRRRLTAQFKLIYGRLLIGLLYLNIFHFALSQGPYTILPLIDRYDRFLGFFDLKHKGQANITHVGDGFAFRNLRWGFCVLLLVCYRDLKSSTSQHIYT
ncbi:T7A14.4 [Arabidopsis thaliana]|uniref:T7A14.4 n=1 Tax=Arabidopsis thaliana TaxID=3702 RepID=Q9ZVP3_ARATH|nr:T7A14.4 [Arabidopsis thaliana]